MATSRSKVWVKELLTFADLNAEFDNLLSGAIDLTGERLTFDSDADTYMLTNTDDRLDFYFQNTDIMRFDGTGTVQNGLDIAFTASGTSPTITARGVDTHLGINIVGTSNGRLEAEADPVLGHAAQQLYYGR